MSNAMDGVSLIRSGVDHHTSNHEDNKGVSSPQEDLGENSNGSSNGDTPGERDEVTAEMTRLSNKKRGSSLVPANNNTGSHHNRHSSSNHNHNSSEVHNTTSRANYCQFETPADETRGTFPDDFDEELFISSGQLVETSNEAGQFDEEMDSSHSHHPDDDHHRHNHLDHPLNLDTADHSESSDIEEIMYPTANSTSTATPTDTCNNNSSNSSRSSGSSTSNNPFQPHNDKPPSLTSSAIQSVPEPMEMPMQEDLSSDNADEPDQNDAQAISLVDSSYVNEQDEVDVNDLDQDPRASSSSPMRKRKGSETVESSDEKLPAKKSVKKDTIDDGASKVENPDVVDEEDQTEEGRDQSKSTRIVIPVRINPPPQMDDWLNIFMGWSHAERLMVINEMIQVCEPTEVRHMMQVIEPQFQRDFISLLPKELALYVLSFLEPKDLLRAAQTCRYWRILCDDNLLWREKCREAGIGYFSAMSHRVHSKRNRGSQPTCPTSSSNRSRNSSGGSESPSNMSRWKAAYLRQHNVEMNWRFRPIRPTKILKGHDDHVITCLQFSANRIVSGSDDNTLKVWSATTGKCLRTLVGHTGGVWSSQMSGTTIVSGSTDRTLRVWNAESGACLHTLYGHTSTVRCMHLYGKKVVSGSRDATLRVWDVESGECLHVLVGHMAAVRCVQYNGTIVVSGAYDYMVRVWDVEREECLHQLSGHTNRVYSLQFDGIHVVSGSLDTSIRVWDVKTGACKHTLMGHQSLTSGMELRDNLLVSGNADSTVKIWDINTGQCLLTLSGPNKHLSAVTCLQLINKFVITSSDDGTVKLWDIRTGDFVRNLVTLTSGGSGGVVWRIRASETKLVCAVGSRNGTEETKLLVLDFDAELFK